MKKIFFIFSTFLMASSAYCQNVYPSPDGKLQTQIGRDAEGFKSCGIRAIILSDDGSGGDAYDLSIGVVRGASAAVISAGKDTYSYGPNSKPGNIPVTPGPVNFWIVKDTDAKPLMASKYIQGSSPKYIMGFVDIIDD